MRELPGSYLNREIESNICSPDGPKKLILLVQINTAIFICWIGFVQRRYHHHRTSFSRGSCLAAAARLHRATTKTTATASEGSSTAAESTAILEMIL